MLGFLSLFVNIPMLIAVAVLILICVGIYFTLGPVKLVQFLLDARVWLFVAIVFGFIALTHSAKTITEQKQEIQSAATVNKAGVDGQATVSHVVKQKAARQVEQNKEQAAIEQAPPGEELDALMDEIAREQAAPAGPGD